MSCFSVSTVHGPAIITTALLPILTTPPLTHGVGTSIMVSVGWNSRLASLYGLETRITLSTLGRDSKDSPRDGLIPTRLPGAPDGPTAPRTPMTVRSTPWDKWPLRPCLSRNFRTRSISASLLVGFMTTIIKKLLINRIDLIDLNARDQSVLWTPFLGDRFCR